MKIASIAMALLVVAPLAQAEGNGEHPAIIARRVIASQGFDYASAFYPHPAGLRLVAEAPRSGTDNPPVVVAKRTGARHHAATSVPARK